ncbi:MAG: hypothetical protein ACFFC7_32560 [Candidatus Hermodarchaeota archaeon]
MSRLSTFFHNISYEFRRQYKNSIFLSSARSGVIMKLGEALQKLKTLQGQISRAKSRLRQHFTNIGAGSQRLQSVEEGTVSPVMGGNSS